jgi:hypothetical protein
MPIETEEPPRREIFKNDGLRFSRPNQCPFSALVGEDGQEKCRDQIELSWRSSLKTKRDAVQ